MNIAISKMGGSAVIAVEGRMDTISAPEFEKRIDTWIGQGELRFVVDMSQLDYISSAGLRSLMLAAKKVSSCGGQLSCCALKGVVKKVFDISGFDKLLPVYESVEEAIRDQ
ncbi:MAG: STAS domain-containing protein [Deltaproteobacteria bacterium]|nr:STAS domain-containing protein [Deltaproteobacteria bacterium]